MSARNSNNLDISTKTINELFGHIRNLYKMNNAGTVNDIRYGRIGPTLNPGDIIRVNPWNLFGDYIVADDIQPLELPEQQFGITTRWSSELTAMPTSGSSAPLQKSVSLLDVDNGELAHYKIAIPNVGYKVEIAQPLENKLHKNRLNLRYVHYGNTMYPYLKNEYVLLPDVFTFEDKTPLKFTAYSTDLDAVNQFSANVLAFGVKYKIKKYNVPGLGVNDDGKIIPGTKLIINLGTPSKAV